MGVFCCILGGQGMSKKIKYVIPLLGISAALTGCLQPTAHSMGATLMPAPLQHRADASNNNQQIDLAASGFWGHTQKSDNVKSVDAGGGNISVTYRLGGFASPLFISGSAGAFGGKLNFACTDSNCESSREKSDYSNWLKTEEGKDDYGFWNLQERILAGLDFNAGPFLIVGAAGGIQLYQGGGDYDDMRDELDQQNIVNDVDGSSGYAPTASAWIGSHFGRHGEYGQFVVEYSLLFKGAADDWTHSMKYTYTHPTGFFGGVSEGNLMSFTAFVGKQFVF